MIRYRKSDIRKEKEHNCHILVDVHPIKMDSEKKRSHSARLPSFQDGAQYTEGRKMFNVGDLVRVIFLVSVLTHPIIHYADKRSRPVTCLAAVSPQSLFTCEYCIVAVGTVNKSVGLKVKQFIWIIPWLFGLQPCLASAGGGGPSRVQLGADLWLTRAWNRVNGDPYFYKANTC